MVWNTPVTDCSDVYNSGYTTDGVYEIQPSQYEMTFNVSCVFDRDGLWTVIQRRVDATTSFDQNWEGYRDGFGDLDSNYW